MENKMSMIDDVLDFRVKFNLDIPDIPRILNRKEFNFCLAHLKEELYEIEIGFEIRKLSDITDGLVDLIYVAINMGINMGLPIEDAWNIIHIANMNKEKANENNPSKRGDINDVVKPKGFKDPKELLAYLDTFVILDKNVGILVGYSILYKKFLIDSEYGVLPITTPAELFNEIFNVPGTLVEFHCTKVNDKFYLTFEAFV
jgi:Phosphoribosyl-ATP pyrophosphohydrolase